MLEPVLGHLVWPFFCALKFPQPCHVLSAAHQDSSQCLLDLIRVLRQLREFATQLHRGFCVGHSPVNQYQRRIYSHYLALLSRSRNGETVTYDGCFRHLGFSSVIPNSAAAG